MGGPVWRAADFPRRKCGFEARPPAARPGTAGEYIDRVQVLVSEIRRLLEHTDAAVIREAANSWLADRDATELKQIVLAWLVFAEFRSAGPADPEGQSGLQRKE